MDVILDSNIFLGDLKFQGTRFPELFAYLRRTGDTLVLPTLVLEETTERYRDRLTNELNKTRRAWELFVKTKMSPHPNFPHVDLDKEVQAYKQRLAVPAPGVKVLHYSDVSGIDVNDVARRGIKRIKPASQAGEELRDVIVWLLAFQYADQSKKRVALISDDIAFRKSKDEDDLHPDLVSEIAGSKLPIHFYREIAAFLTSQSLSQKTIEESWLPKFVDVSEMSKRIALAISATQTPYGWPYDVSNDGPQFAEGTAYQVSEDSVYAELKYKGRARLFFERITAFSSVFVTEPLMRMHGAGISLGEGFRETINLWATQAEPAGRHLYTTNFDDVLAGSKLGDNFVVTNPGSRPNIQLVEPPFKFDALFEFEAWLSARVEKEKLVSWQVDQVALIEAK